MLNINPITNPQVLLIEDSYSDQVIFKEFLAITVYSEAKIKTLEKISEVEALSKSDYEPELIVLDLNLPDSYGLNTFKHVQKIFPSVPIIVLTGMSDKDLGLQAISLGAEDYLIKGKQGMEEIERMIAYAIERFKLKKSLLTSNQKLRMTQEKMEQFIYMISHDLNAPVSSAKGLINLLKEDKDNNQRTHILDLTQNALDLLTTKLKSLNDILRIQKNEEKGKEIDLTYVIHQVLEESSLALNFQDFDCYIDIPVDTKIIFPETLLHSIIQNIVSNAIKYREPKRGLVLKFEIRDSKKYRILSIQDNGIGMDLQNNKESIFGLFRRYHTHVSGSGIGLYLVKSIMESNEGYIDVESKPDVGTSFHLYFKNNAS